MCETIKGYEEISEGEAFSEYIHRICIPFFDYALTAVEYMVDEHATLEVAFQETVVGELCGVEIADVELFRPAQPDSSPVWDAVRTMTEQHRCQFGTHHSFVSALHVWKTKSAQKPTGFQTPCNTVHCKLLKAISETDWNYYTLCMDKWQ